MYISVIPLARSQSRTASTYFVTPEWQESIVIGGLVEMPFGKALTEGIIADMMDTPGVDSPSIEILPIIRVISSTPVVTHAMIAMILRIAERYMLLIHKVASLFLPAPLLTRLDTKNYIITPGEISHRAPPSREIYQYLDHIFSPGDIVSYLRKGTVFIFPDDIFLTLFQREWSADIGDHDISVLYHHATPTKRSSFWIDTYEGKYDIIFGTRRILYYNLRAYTHIIYVEDAFATEQYSYPTRLQNLDVLSAFSATHPQDITIISSTPTLALLSEFSHYRLLAHR